MQHLIRTIIPVITLTLLAGCEPPPATAFSYRGTPESLLDISSEVVNLNVASGDEVKQLGDWIAKDQPTRAELYCTSGDLHCADAQKILDLRAVPSTKIPSDRRMVSLVYERVLARDCNARYSGKKQSMYGESDPGFGCATAANIVQHVSNKGQFVNPNISDVPSAIGATLTYQRAYAPKEDFKAYNAGEEQTR